MTNVIRSVQSGDGIAHTLLVPGYDTINPVTIPSSGTVDLLTTLSPETLHAMQPELNLAVANGQLSVVSTITVSQLWALASGGGGLSTALTSAHLFVGNVSNIATDRALTGDVSITNTGVSTVSNATNLTSRVITGNGSSIKLQLKPSVDSTTALEITNAAGSGTPIFIVDTVDGFVGINSTAGVLHRPFTVGGDATVTGDFLAATIHINGGTFTLEGVFTQATILALTPPAGTLAFASDTQVLLLYNGTTWVQVTTQAHS